MKGPTATLTHLALLLARVLLSALFIQSGFAKLTSYAYIVGYFHKLGLPFPPAAWAVAVAMELGGGLLILAGYRARLVAPLMAVFTVATALIVHYHRGDAGQMLQFYKNLAIAGGFLQLAATGPGRFAVGRS